MLDLCSDDTDNNDKLWRRGKWIWKRRQQFRLQDVSVVVTWWHTMAPSWCDQRRIIIIRTIGVQFPGRGLICPSGGSFIHLQIWKRWGESWREKGGEIFWQKKPHIFPTPPPPTLASAVVHAPCHYHDCISSAGGDDGIGIQWYDLWTDHDDLVSWSRLGDESDGAAALAQSLRAPSEVGCKRTICLPYKRCAMNCCMRNLAVWTGVSVT